MVAVTFTVPDTKKVEFVDRNTKIADIASSKRINSSEKIYVDGNPVEDRSKTLGDIIGAKTSCSFNVITKTNNAR